MDRKDVHKFSRVVSREEIRENDYNLNIPRYVDSSEETEHWDIYATMFGGIPKSELDTMEEVWKAFPNLRKELFIDNGTPYVHMAVSEKIKEAVKKHSDVVGFENTFNKAFESFPNFLKEMLITQMDSIEIPKAEGILSEDIFKRLENIPLVDKYAAFQLLDDEWTKVAIDLEIIQTEGFESVKKVDPNLVIKKKDGKEQEIQDGWIGHVIPFELVQLTLLKQDYDEIKDLESKMAEIPSEYESILEEMTEDQKEACKDVLNEDGNAFVPKGVSKMVKMLKKDKTEESIQLYDILSKVESLMKDEKDTKAAIKKKSAELQEKTKETIENLSDEEAIELLEEKWIVPVNNNIHKLPESIIDEFVRKIQTLTDKYAVTLMDIEKQIDDTEAELSSMMDDLVGNEYDMKGLGELKALLLGE